MSDHCYVKQNKNCLYTYTQVLKLAIIISFNPKTFISIYTFENFFVSYFLDISYSFQMKKANKKVIVTLGFRNMC